MVPVECVLQTNKQPSTYLNELLGRSVTDAKYSETWIAQHLTSYIVEIETKWYRPRTRSVGGLKIGPYHFQFTEHTGINHRRK